MKISKVSREIIVILAGLVALGGCTPKKPVSAEGVSIEKTLKAAEKDARSGNEEKALQEIDAAEKALIAEDKKKPYAQQSKTWSGEDAKATAERDAIKELDRARKDAKGKLAGDAADDIKKELKDVEVKEAQ
jgi:microtubule-associated protein 1